MSFMSAVAGAGGGGLDEVAMAAGFDAAATRSAMDALCPAIARQLQDKAKADPELLGSLLDLLEDNTEADGPGGEEAMLDGGAMLKALYGSEAAALKSLRSIVPEVPQPALAVLAPVSAAAVIAAVGQQQAAPLTGALPIAGGSLLGTIVSAIIAGAIKGAVRQITSSATRRASPSGTRTRTRKRTTPKKTRTARKRSTSGINLEDILGGIFGTKRN